MADDVKETFEQEVMKEEEVKTTDTEEGARVEEKILEEAKQPEALHSRSGNDNKPT